jgi:NAD(P)-dependent dehydrogenase (short-subunit alcohol dehydrogenase family)
MEAFVRVTVSPTIYFVGRNETAAATITASLQRLNPTAKITFLRSDVSLLRNAYSAATTIREKESAINLLVVSPGYMSLAGRTPTEEGLEKKMVINYYSRVLFASVFLPLLKSGAQNAELGARVISVYAPGTEGPIIEDDMELERNFSVGQAASQAAAFQSLAFEHLATVHPEIGWLHVNPGAVKTGLLRDMPLWVRALTPVFSVITTSAEDCGQGMLRLSTDEKYKTGLALVDWKGDGKDSRHGKKSWLGKGGWWKEGLPEKVWTHTEEVYQRVLGKKI